MHLSEIYLYPVKSCAGYPVQHTRLDRFGPAGDRRWMLVDSEGEFMTQRSHPRMCLIRTTSRSDLSLGLGFHRGQKILLDLVDVDRNEGDFLLLELFG